MEKLMVYIDFILKGRNPIKMVILFSNFELDGLKNDFTKTIRGRSDYNLIHVVPNLVSKDSFHEIADNDLLENYEDNFVKYCYDQLDFEGRKEIIKNIEIEQERRRSEYRRLESWRINNNREDYAAMEDESQKAIIKEFYRDMNEETDGFWMYDRD
jgi:hypothetical protein